MKAALAIVVALFALLGRSPIVEGQDGDNRRSGLPSAEPVPVRGVSLGLDFIERDATYVSYLWEIASSGADAVSLVVGWSQPSVRSNALRPSHRTPLDSTVRDAIRQAHSLGLRVFLLPLVHLEDREPGEWRGTMAPDDTDAWFESYRAFMNHYAELAESEDVWMLSVGSELGSLERHSAAWRRVIADARARYSGVLTYSANWDRYFNTPFWDALDVAGVTAYHELASSSDAVPPLEALVDAWHPFIEALDVFARGVDRRVIITEIGYVSQRGAAARPWDYTLDGGVDLESQERLFVAMREVWRSADFVDGMFVWNWFGRGGASDGGYTPRGKPSELVLRDWFSDRGQGE